jgi:hypothetical protein
MLEHFSFSGLRSASGAAYTLPTDTLQSLQQLTYLELRTVELQALDDLQHIQGITRLQDLRLGLIGDHTIQASMLSGSEKLTCLELLRGPPGRGCRIWPGVVSKAPQVQHLALVDCSIANGAAGVEQLMAHLQHVQQLTYLNLRGSLWNCAPVPAAAYSSLTANSKLQHLDISDCVLAAGAWQHVFPPGRQLPALRELHIAAVRFLETPSYNYVTAHVPVAELVGCCLGLQTLSMKDLHFAWNIRESERQKLQLAQLRHLTHLEYAYREKLCCEVSSFAGLAARDSIHAATRLNAIAC